MNTHPVRFDIASAPARDRLHLVLRLVIFIALSAVNAVSVNVLFYLLLPPVVAVALWKRGSKSYLDESVPKLSRVLRWLAAAFAYLALLTDAFPGEEGDDKTRLTVAPSGNPTATSALVRLVTSFPAFVLLMLLSCVATLLWIFGAIAIAVNQRLPSSIVDFLTLTLRFQLRLVAYHLSWVDQYPSLQESSGELPQSPAVGGAA